MAMAHDSTRGLRQRADAGPADTPDHSAVMAYSVLERLLERADTIITVLEADGALRWSAGGALSVFGAHVGLEAGEDALSVIHPDEVGRARASFEDLLAGRVGRDQPLEFRIRTTEGRFHYMEAFAESLLDDPDIGGIVVYAHDVTERHDWMEERDRLLEELRGRADELAINAAHREELMAALAHELRTPLTTISGFCELMTEEIVTSDERPSSVVQEYLATINDAVRRLVRLTGDLEFLSEVGPGGLRLKSAPVDVATVARRSVDRARRTAASKKVDLHTSIRRGPELMGDEDRIAQVVDNLLSNAIKFTPSGGRVDLRVSPVDSGWRIQCNDTGIGVPDEELRLVLDRFYRGSNARTASVAGSGIGLSVVRAIVEGHRGTIRIDSEEGAGTRVTVTLRGLGG